MHTTSTEEAAKARTMQNIIRNERKKEKKILLYSEVNAQLVLLYEWSSSHTVNI